MTKRIRIKEIQGKYSSIFDLNNLTSVFGLSLILLAFSCTQSSLISFEHHVIANPLPGKAWGTGGFTLADYDKDGDLDATIQCRSDDDKVYWYEYAGADNWIPHFLGVAREYQLGSTAIDVNRDGYIDLVLGHIWFQNPGVLDTEPDTEWKGINYNGDMPHENHDIVTADINMDQIPDVVMYNQTSSTLRWYNLVDPYNWTFIDIASDVNENDVHSGIFPNGIADLDNDGYPDAVMPMFWYKNPGSDSGKWIKKEWPYKSISPNPYGWGVRVWLGDINNDGFNDLVYSDCDVQYSKVYLLINKNAGESWGKTELPLPESNVGESGSFHSLQVADFDNDGDLDIFAGEQEDATKLMKPQGLEERGIIFENTGTKQQPEFSAFVIHKNNPGWHDALIGDVDGDGDIDIVSKVWNADTTVYHMDYWENKLY